MACLQSTREADRPRAEIWAVLVVLMVWDGSYDLAIINNASYTVQGMDALARRRNGRGPNRDIWQLIYAELDSKQGEGASGQIAR